MNRSAVCPNLDVEAFKKALTELTPVDMVYIHKKGRIFALGTSLDVEDLLDEAILRTLDGTRICPGDLPVRVYLVGAMRSIANGERKKDQRLIIADHTAEPASQEAHAGDPLAYARNHNPLANARDPSPPTEIAAMHLQQVEQILGHMQDLFDNDPHAQAVFMGMAEQWTTAQIKELEPMNDKEYDAARQRVRRAIERYARENDND